MHLRRVGVAVGGDGYMVEVRVVRLQQLFYCWLLTAALASVRCGERIDFSSDAVANVTSIANGLLDGLGSGEGAGWEKLSCCSLKFKVSKKLVNNYWLQLSL